MFFVTVETGKVREQENLRCLLEQCITDILQTGVDLIYARKTKLAHSITDTLQIGVDLTYERKTK
jgi:hypothetical protein